MSIPFNANRGLVIIPATLEGPSGTAHLNLALDTGATATLISSAILIAVGYDPALAPTRVQVTTGSGVESVPLLSMNKLTALGQDRFAFPVLGHTLPPSASVDGVLGLDFLRGRLLTLDFRNGLITLA